MMTIFFSFSSKGDCAEYQTAGAVGAAMVMAFAANHVETSSHV